MTDLNKNFVKPLHSGLILHRAVIRSKSSAGVSIRHGKLLIQ